ncbi:MAG TPA: hypothetical protein VJP02_26785 [Candidatus Sulfotelmatobacter sp.]|nr:hypothetical protein [Candidatus Sulfotelmatobacter sp.]
MAPSNGFLLTSDDNNATYAIILHNVRTYRSAGVIAVVRGKQKAESTLKAYQESQSSVDHHEGWRYFFEKTSVAPGTDPAEATKLRQDELELRESKAPPDSTDWNSRK